MPQLKGHEAVLIRSDQCMDGADCTKPTGLLGPRHILETFGQVCNHPNKWWVYPDGTWIQAPHAPLRRRGWSGAPSPRPVAPEDWLPGQPSFCSHYPTRDKKAYPGGLNKRLVDALLSTSVPEQPTCPASSEAAPSKRKSPAACTFSTKRFVAAALPAACSAHNHLDDMVFEQRPVKPASLRGQQEATKVETRLAEDEAAIGGMRNPAKAVERNPRAMSIGAMLLRCLQGLLLANATELSVIDTLGSANCCGFQPAFVEAARAGCAKVLGFHYDKASGASARSSLRPDFISGYVEAANDPEAHLASWVRDGCPLGIRNELTPSGIFPAVNARERPAADAEILQTDAASFSNYASLDDWPGPAQEQVQKLVDKGYVEEFQSFEAMAAAIGEQPVLSKLALISKERASGDWKHRLIVDLLRSDVNSHICQGERIILPRIGDAVIDGLRIRRAGLEGVESMVSDFADAFFMLPIAEDEQKFVSFTAFGKYYLAKSLMFGARSSPTLWGRCAAFLARSSQSMFSPASTTMQMFVDDAIVQTRGPRAQRRMAFSIVLLWWCVLGAQIAWGKGCIGSRVDWIGASISHTPKFVVVAVKEEILQSALALVQNIARLNVVSTAKVRSLAGKLSFMAGIVPVLRPFVAELWAAIAQASARDSASQAVRPSRAAQRARPPNTIWVKQVSHGLAWISAFLLQSSCKLQRAYLIDTSCFDRFEIWCDASPWGLGAVLIRQSRSGFEILEYLASGLCPYELERFQLARGDPAGQALASRSWLPLEHGVPIGHTPHTRSSL